MKFIKIASQSTDPTERLKLISTGLIADLAHPMILCLGQPPLPSFPKEFLEGYLKDGTYIKMVQLIRAGDAVNTTIKVTGPDNCYKIECEISAFARPWSMTDPNCIVAGQKRKKWEITLQDGTVYRYVKFPILFFLTAIGSPDLGLSRLLGQKACDAILQ